MKRPLCALAILLTCSALQAQNSWYLHADCTNWNTLSNWYSAPSGGTNPTALNSADTYYCNGYTMRSPEAAAAASFPGTLVLNGRYGVVGGEMASSALQIKLKTNTVHTAVAHLVTNGGATRVISNSVGGTQSMSLSTLTLTKNELTTFSTGLNTALNLSVGAIRGGGDVCFGGGGNISVTLTNADLYYGTVFITGSTIATINGNTVSKGGLIIETGSQVRLNGNISVSSFRVNAATNATDSFFGLRSSGVQLAPNTTYSFAELNTFYPSVFTSGTGSITVTEPHLDADAAQVVNEVSPYHFGANLSSGTFWMSQTPDMVADMKKAKLSMIRVGGYPKHGGPNESVQMLDMRVIQTLNAGALPQFIQLIDTAAHNPPYAAALLDLQGNTGTGGTVATNMTYLVKRYMAPPFNLTTQYWEVGNEPDISIDYQVSSPAEYVAFYQSIHDQLVAAGVRQNVKLCGPTVAFEYGFAANGNRTDNILRAVVSACAAPRNGYNQLDVLTRHVYPELYNWETDAPDPAVTPYNYLNHPTEMVTFTPTVAHKSYRGEYALHSLMNSYSYPQSVSTGITEYQVSDVFRHTITQGLWFLIYDHFVLYNPRNVLGAGFLYTNPSHPMSYYSPDKVPSFGWWATYMHGNLTGKQVVAQNSSDPHLLLTATKDASYVYLQVLNRNTSDMTARVNLRNASVTGSPTLFILDSTARPDQSETTALGPNFTYTFPAMTSRVFRFKRSDAPPTPPALPPLSTVLMDDSFDATPVGFQSFTNNVFTPTISGGALKITSTTGNTATAAVLNGKPLPTTVNRFQAKINLRIDNGHAGTGITFGAYSSTPNGVGAPAAGLGYFGQSNRLFGVKLQNKGADPDQLGIVPTTCSSTVEGWATRAIPPYYGMDLLLVVDYDGSEGGVRARLYQGATEAGTLFADITNRVGNVPSLPAGTVFGFTGSTQSFAENTFIQRVQILTGNTSSEPQNLISNPGLESDPATQTPSGWTEWKTPLASYTEASGGGHTGAYHGTHSSSATSYEVSTYQIKTGLAAGVYTLRAWVKSSGGQISQLYAKGFDASLPSNRSSTAIATAGTWTQITIPNINVSSGQCEVGLWSKTSTAGKWIYFDDVEFYKQ